MSQSGMRLYVGLTDRGREGFWRFPTNNEHFDPNSSGSLFKWESGEPNNNNGGEDCVHVQENLKHQRLLLQQDQYIPRIMRNQSYRLLIFIISVIKICKQ